MNVCIVTNEIIGPHRNGGIGTANSGLAEQLASTGHGVTILYTSMGPTGPVVADRSFAYWQSIYRQIGVELVAIPQTEFIRNSISDSSFMSLQVYNWLKNHRFDVIYFNDYYAFGYHTLTAKALGLFPPKTSLIVVSHSGHAWLREVNKAPFGSKQVIQLAWMERRCVELADHLLSSSLYMIDWMRGQGWRVPDSATVIPSVMPSASFRQVFAGDSAGRRSVEVQPALRDPSITEFVFFGRMELRKGFDLFLDALDLYARDRPDDSAIGITFLGKFSKILGLHTGAEALERCRSWPGRVRLLPHYAQPEALSYLRYPGRLAVIPSLVDNSPAVLLECLYEQIPLIASGVGGIPELLADEDHERLLFEPTPRALAEKLRAAARDGVPIGRPRHTPDQITRQWHQWHQGLARALDVPDIGQIPAERVSSEAARSLTTALTGSASTAASPWLLPSRSAHQAGPLVSVVIAHFNRPQLLRRALTSIQQQTYRSLEVIIVDDGSTLPEAIRFVEDLAANEERDNIRIIRQENKYLGAARNAGARLAHGKYLFFMDDDNVAFPWEIDTMVHAAEHARLDIVTCLSLFIRDTDTLLPENAHIGYLPVGQHLPSSLLDNVFGDANCLFLHETFDALGGFSEKYGFACQDYLLFFRAALAGYRQEVVPEPLYYYQITGGSMLRRSHPFDDLSPIYEAAALHGLGEFRDVLDLFIGTNLQARVNETVSRRVNVALWQDINALDPNAEQQLALLGRLAARLGRPDEAVELALLGSAKGRPIELDFNDWDKAGSYARAASTTLTQSTALTPDALRGIIASPANLTAAQDSSLAFDEQDGSVVMGGLGLGVVTALLAGGIPEDTYEIIAECAIEGAAHAAAFIGITPETASIAGFPHDMIHEGELVAASGWSAFPRPSGQLHLVLHPDRAVLERSDLHLGVRVTGAPGSAAWTVRWGKITVKRRRPAYGLHTLDAGTVFGRSLNITPDIGRHAVALRESNQKFNIFEYFKGIDEIQVHPIQGEISCVVARGVLPADTAAVTATILLAHAEARPVEFRMVIGPADTDADAILSMKEASGVVTSPWVTLSSSRLKRKITVMADARTEARLSLYLMTRMKHDAPAHFAWARWTEICVLTI